MFQDQNLEPLHKIYDYVHVLEVKVHNPELEKIYIKEANDYNNVAFSDPINTGTYCFNNYFHFYLPEEVVLSRAKKYSPYILNIELKKYVQMIDKCFPVEYIRFNLSNSNGE